MMTVIIFILLLAVLVLVHEWGHFWTARKFKIKVEEFGIGFPPRVFGKVKNGVLYSLNWLPLGGFVKIKGEDGSQRDEKDSFGAQKAWKRIVVLSAGVIMNFLLAAVLLSIGFMFGLPQSIDGISEGNVRDVKIQVINVLDGFPASDSGIQIGDAITKINGVSVASINQLIELTDSELGKVAQVEIARGSDIITKNVDVVPLESTGKGGIGVGLIQTGVVSYSIPVSIYKGFEATALLTGQILDGFYNIIKSLIAGNGPGVDVSGPVGIAVLTGQVAQLGFAYLLQFAAILSINLAVINFLPFPALDGGRVVFVIIEKLRGKPVNSKLEGAFHAAGFALLMLLIIVVTYKDIIRYFN